MVPDLAFFVCDLVTGAWELCISCEMFFFLFFFLSIILYVICTGYTVVQSTKQVCTQIREIKEYNINNNIILMP